MFQIKQLNHVLMSGKQTNCGTAHFWQKRNWIWDPCLLNLSYKAYSFVGFYFVNKLCEMTIQRHRRIGKDTETDKFLPRAAKLTQSSSLAKAANCTPGAGSGTAGRAAVTTESGRSPALCGPITASSFSVLSPLLKIVSQWQEYLPGNKIQENEVSRLIYFCLFAFGSPCFPACLDRVLGSLGLGGSCPSQNHILSGGLISPFLVHSPRVARDFLK